MSRLREFKIKHQGMTIEQKEACNCELCKGCNVDKTKRTVPSDKKFITTKQKVVDIKAEPLIAPNQKIEFQTVETKIIETIQVETSKVEAPKTSEIPSVEPSLELPRKRVIRRTHLINNTIVPEGLSDIKI